MVGRVERLLELAGKAKQERISEQARTPMPYFQCKDAQNEFQVAAVNLVEPLARDWQHKEAFIRRIAELDPYLGDMDIHGLVRDARADAGGAVFRGTR